MTIALIIAGVVLLCGLVGFFSMRDDRVFHATLCAIIGGTIAGLITVACIQPMRTAGYTDQIKAQGYTDVNVSSYQDYFTGSNQQGKYCQGWFLSDGDQVKAIWALSCYDSFEKAPAR